MTDKPEWWPRNPYPVEIFPMPRKEYEEVVPDPHLRTALSGMLGREFWEIASDMIWDAFQNHIDDMTETEHLTQPLEKDKNGITRYKKNPIVRFLLDTCPFDLNKLWTMSFDNDDWRQLYQLIGYSKDGYDEIFEEKS